MIVGELRATDEWSGVSEEAIRAEALKQPGQSGDGPKAAMRLRQLAQWRLRFLCPPT